MEAVLLIVVSREVDFYLLIYLPKDGLLLYFLRGLTLVYLYCLPSVELEEDGL